jgi:hypothetical protein
MAYLAVLNGQMPFYILRTFCPDVELTGSVAYFASCVLQAGSFSGADKTSRFAVSGRVAIIASFDLILSQSLFHSFNASERSAFLCIRREILIFTLMAFLT